MVIRTPSDSTPVPGLTWRYDDQQQPPRLTVTGEIDLATIDQFAAALDRSTARHPELVVDLRGLAFLGAAGIGELLRHRNSITQVLVAPSGIAHRLLSCTDFTDGLPVTTEEHQPQQAATVRGTP